MTRFQNIYLGLVLFGFVLVLSTFGENSLPATGFAVMWFMYICARMIIDEIKKLKKEDK